MGDSRARDKTTRSARLASPVVPREPSANVNSTASRVTTESSAIENVPVDREPQGGVTARENSARNDELFMRMVLSHPPFHTASTARTDAWTSIATAFVTGGGFNIANGEAVTKRLGVLTTMLLELPHLLTPTLRRSVLEFNERNRAAGYATRLDAFVLPALRDHAARGIMTLAMTTLRQAKDASRVDDAISDERLDDECLLREVLQYRPFETDARARAWLHVMQAYNRALAARKKTRGALMYEQSAEQRVERVMTALTSWALFRQLAPAMRAMLVECSLLSLEIPLEEATSTTSQKEPLAVSQRQVSADPSSEPSPVSPTPGRLEHRDVDALFVEIVLQKRPFDAKSGARTDVWNEIARACAAAGGEQLKSGGSAQSRMSVLTKWLLTEPSRLAPTVRKMVLQYNELNFQSGMKTSIDQIKLEKLRAHATANDDTPTTPTTQPQVNDVRDKGVSAREIPTEAASPVAVLRNTRQQSASSAVASPIPAIRSTRTRTSKRPVASEGLLSLLEWDSEASALSASESDSDYDSSMEEEKPLGRVDASVDEPLVRVVLSVRPWSFPHGQRMKAWEQVAKAWKVQVGTAIPRKYFTSVKASARAQRLCKMYSDPSTPGSADLTPQLKALILEYHQAAKNDSTRQRSVPPQSTESFVESIDPARDETIVQQFLNLRPFWIHTKCTMPMWDSIAASIDSPQLLSGLQVRDHVEWLSGVAQDEGHAQHQQLGARLLDLLKEYVAFPDYLFAATYWEVRAIVMKEGLVPTNPLMLDDIMLQEALAITPRWSLDQWNAMVDRLHTRYDARVFPSGAVCMARVQRLLQVFHSDHADPSITLTKHQEQQLRALSEATNSNVGATLNDSTLRTSRRRELPVTAADNDQGSLIKRRRVIDTDTDVASAYDAEDYDSEMVFQVAVELLPFRDGYIESRLWWDSVALELHRRQGHRGRFKNGRTLQQHVDRVLDCVKTDPAMLSTKLQHLASQFNTRPSDERPRSTVAPTSAAGMMDPQISRRDATHESSIATYEAEAAELRGVLTRIVDDEKHGPATVTATRESTSQPLQPPREVTTTDRTDDETTRTDPQIAQLLTAFELERREFRAQQDALVALLQAEREAQRRETKALLEAIDRERQDRRDEFVAMAKLMERSFRP